jgi:hypothetical protein
MQTEDICSPRISSLNQSCRGILGMALALIMTKKGGKGAMKFYIAKMCDLDTQEMNYTQFGKSGELYIEFPEFREVIDRYHLRSIDVRFVNGDRLRIYDIKEGRLETMREKAASDYGEVVLQT